MNDSVREELKDKISFAPKFVKPEVKPQPPVSASKAPPPVETAPKPVLPAPVVKPELPPVETAPKAPLVLKQSAAPVAESVPEVAEKTPENIVEPSFGSTLFESDYTPPTTAETIRNSGLAWSAGIVLFGAVVFMMIFGWFADLLLGSSPWGLLGGIILGGIIGFVQVFRISSQIFRK